MFMIENINNFSPFYWDLKVLFETKKNFSNKATVRFEVSFYWRRAEIYKQSKSSYFIDLQPDASFNGWNLPI